jgi:hypothetical protein
MARNKRDLEKLEAIVARSPEQPPPAGLTEYVQDLINDGLGKANPRVRTDAEGLQILRGLIDAETNPDKREFHEMIFGIATRLAHRKKPLSVSNDAAQSDSVSEPLPLHERIKFLRERLN